jgi:hypothetical protein
MSLCVYELMINIEKKLEKDNIIEYGIFDESSFDIKEYSLITILEYLLQEKEKDILMFVPKLKMYFISMYEQYHLLTNQDNSLKELIREYITYYFNITSKPITEEVRLLNLLENYLKDKDKISNESLHGVIDKDLIVKIITHILENNKKNILIFTPNLKTYIFSCII